MNVPGKGVVWRLSCRFRGVKIFSKSSGAWNLF
jgi:hypothetical protein